MFRLIKRWGLCPIAHCGMPKLIAMAWLSTVFLVTACLSTEIVEDKKLLKDVQKLLIDSKIATQVNLPKVIFYHARPAHFNANWAGLCRYEAGTIEILILGHEQFDMDTYYHEMYHWFTLDVDNNRAEKFASIARRWFKGKVAKSVTSSFIGE
jgi:hypothetical protein